MMQKTKIQLLPFELELVSSPHIILTKNTIMHKLKLFLHEIELKQKQIISDYISVLPQEIMNIPPKISRGENYQGLPWLVLDNPRYFQKDKTFAVRTMFWWGNYFSITLHLSGEFKTKLQNKILSKIVSDNKPDFFIADGKNEWNHDLSQPGYKKISSFEEDELKNLVLSNNFLKLAVKFPVNTPEDIEVEMCSSYNELIKLCI